MVQKAERDLRIRAVFDFRPTLPMRARLWHFATTPEMVAREGFEPSKPEGNGFTARPR